MLCSKSAEIIVIKKEVLHHIRNQSRTPIFDIVHDIISKPFYAMLVQPDMKEWVAATLAKEAGSNGSRRMLSVNAHMAAGILEGLETFGFKSRN